MKKIYIILFIIILCNGCASVPLELESKDEQVKKFNTNQNRSKIFIYRNKFIAGALKYQIWVNEKYIGAINSLTYFAITTQPGKYNIRVTSSNEIANYNVETRANQNHFIFIDTHMGFFTSPISITETSEEIGKKNILKRKLAKREGPN